MGRKNKNAAKRKAPPLPPSIELDAPTAEQMRQAEYHRDEIIHAETFTRATVHRIRQVSSLRKLLDDRQINDKQHFAAQQIAFVAERIERNAAVQCASLEARVDCSGSGRDVLVERLSIARLERTYGLWRTRIAMPRRMIIDMVLADRALFATARKYGVGWPRAKRLLCNALDMWTDLHRKTCDEVSQEDLDKAQVRACA